MSRHAAERTLLESLNKEQPLAAWAKKRKVCKKKSKVALGAQSLTLSAGAQEDKVGEGFVEAEEAGQTMPPPPQ